MQLFILDYKPYKAAKMLADCHVRKQILETAQILTAVWVNGGNERLEWMPKPQNYNHPVCKAINSQAKTVWLLDYFTDLLFVYVARFNKQHAYSGLPVEYCKAFATILEKDLRYSAEDLTFKRMFTGFSTSETDIVKAYREYYKYKKSVIKNWKFKNENEPEWLQ